MEYLLVFAIRTAILIENFIKTCFFAGLTHVVSQPGALLRLVLNPWPKENNMVHNYQAGSQRCTISYCSPLWPTHKQEVAICLPHTGSKAQSVTLTHHPAYQASKGFCVQEEEWCSFSLLKGYELKIKVNILYFFWEKTPKPIRIHQTVWKTSYNNDQSLPIVITVGVEKMCRLHPYLLSGMRQVAHRKKWEKKTKYICVACCILGIKSVLFFSKEVQKV